MSAEHTPLLLMILDGWGYRSQSEGNAIAMADTPNWDRLWQNEPHALLETSGEAVGLPAGQMGNSEVGHMNIGAGRIVYQDFSRIENAIEDGSILHNPALCAGIDSAVATDTTVHLMGLLSPGGVHSHEIHFLALVKMAVDRGARRIAVHLFLDGRDTPPRSADPSIKKMENLVNSMEGVRIATVSGRYFAMDRDNRWERVQVAYEAISAGQAVFSAPSASSALADAYTRGENDEFVSPTVVGGYRGVLPGDSIIFVNFRADRARELTRAFVQPDFDGFERTPIQLGEFVCMTEYQAGLPVQIAFPTESLPDLLADVLAKHNLRQLRIAETEKYAHVTFFFNGGSEVPVPGEERTLIPSPQVATYDLQPEMSSVELTDKLVEAITGDQFDVIICNVANPDMVGHTGSLEAAIKAVEAVDRCLGRVTDAIDQSDGVMLITADHGNVEQMFDATTRQSHTAHTTNPVPLLLHGPCEKLKDTGTLRDIAPTMLDLLDLEKPGAMTGQSMIVRH